MDNTGTPEPQARLTTPREEFAPLSIQDMRELWTEHQFQLAVEGELLRGGWLFHHEQDSRKDRTRGLPDVIAVRNGVILFAELKRQKDSKWYDEQKRWRVALERAAAESGGRILYHAWKPEAFPYIEELLR